MKFILQNAISNRFFLCLIAILIIAIGGYLRTVQYTTYPPIGDTADEFKSVFAGITLLQTGTPTSWSYQPIYDHVQVKIINNTLFPLAQPWVDEPPLFPIITGIYSIAQGDTTFQQVNIASLRQLMIITGMINIGLLFLLLYILGQKTEAVVTSLMYATIPSVILSSRLAVSENLLITFTLLCMIFAAKFVQTNSKKFFVPLILLIPLLPLLKTTTLFIPLALFLLFIAYKKYFAAMFILALTISGFGIWFVYGFLLNKSIFIQMLTNFNGRGLTDFSVITNFFNFFSITTKKLYLDGWIIWGWISVLGLFFWQLKDKTTTLAYKILIFTLGSYFILFTIMSGEPRGWYKIPLYPLLYWSGAILVVQTFKNPRFIPIFLFITLPLFTSLTFTTGPTNWSTTTVKFYQIFTLFLLGPALLYEVIKTPALKHIVQTTFISAFIFAIILNFITILLSQSIVWYYPIETNYLHN